MYTHCHQGFIEGEGHWDFPSPSESPPKFENYDVIIVSTATIGYTTQ